MTTPTELLAAADAARTIGAIVDELERAVIGKRAVLELVVLELRALRRLVGTLFLVAVVLALVLPAIAAFVASS